MERHGYDWGPSAASSVPLNAPFQTLKTGVFPPQLTSCLFLLLPPGEHRSGLHLFLMALSSSRLISTDTNQARQQL